MTSIRIKLMTSRMPEVLTSALNEGGGDRHGRWEGTGGKTRKRRAAGWVWCMRASNPWIKMKAATIIWSLEGQNSMQQV